MRTAWIVAAAYMLVQIAFALHRWHILTFNADTGTFAQAILDTAHGFRDAPEGGSHFRFHFSPILAVAYPFVALSHSSLVLQFIQAVLIALTAPAIVALFGPYASPWLRGTLSVMTLLYAPLASVGFTEFHEAAFFPLVLLLMLGAADRQRWGWFAVFAVACLLIREDIGIEAAVVSVSLAAILYARRKRPNRRGLLFGEPLNARTATLAFALLGCISLLVTFGYFYAEHRILGQWQPSENYDYPFAKGPLGIAAALFTQPSLVLPALYNTLKLQYIVMAFLPLAFLPLRSAWTLASLPAFAILLLSSNPYQWTMGKHYSAMWAPWLLIAAGMALVRLERSGNSRRARGWAIAALSACVLVELVANPMHLGYYLRPMYSNVAHARAALGCVPDGASVSTHEEWFSQVAALNPKSNYNVADGVDYLVYASDYNDYFERDTMAKLRAAVAAGRYVQVCRFGEVATYARRGLNLRR